MAPIKTAENYTANLEKEFLSIAETADFLNKSTKTISRMIAAGEIKAFRSRPKKGSPWSIHRNAIADYLNFRALPANMNGHMWTTEDIYSAEFA